MVVSTVGVSASNCCGEVGFHPLPTSPLYIGDSMPPIAAKLRGSMIPDKKSSKRHSKRGKRK